MSTERKLPTSSHKFSAPLPVTRADWVLKIGHAFSFNDRVQRIHEVLIDNPRYLTFLQATYNEEAVEGNILDDSCQAAQMLRDQAVIERDEVVAAAKLATIRKALNVVLRRFGVSRKQRRNMIGGEVLLENNPSPTGQSDQEDEDAATANE